MSVKHDVFVSDQHKVAYITNPKAGCTSLKAFICESEPKYKFKFPIGQKQSNGIFARFIKNLTAAEIKSQYNDYFTFSFVRNPYMRAWSAYKDKCKNNYKPFVALGFNKSMTFEQYLTHLNSLPKHIRPDYHLATQSSNIPRDVNFVGRLENFAQDLTQLCAITKMVPLAYHLNQTRGTSEHIFTQKEKSLIEKYYQEDFIRFNYATMT